MDRKTKVIKEVSKRLTATQRRLLELVAFENRKDKLTVRMPSGVISLEEIYKNIVEVCAEFEIPFTRTGTFATLEELDDILTDVSWLWPGWIPKGFVSMLVGDPGIGKSMVALDWVRIVTNGVCWPMDNEKNECMNTIWVDTEASQQLLNMRSKALGVNRKRVAIPVIDGDILAQVDLSIQEHKDHLISMIEGRKPTLMVLDSLSGSHNRAENKVEDIKPIMEFLALIARDYNLAVLAIHHLNKGHQQESPEISIYRVRGSIAIPQFARSIIALERQTDNITRLRVIKSNLARVPKPITVITEADPAGEVSGMNYAAYEPPKAKKNKKETCADWVVRMLMLEEEEGMGFKILEELGIPEGYTRSTIYAAKEILCYRVTVTGTGRSAFWHLSDNLDTESVRSIIGANNGRKGVHENA